MQNHSNNYELSENAIKMTFFLISGQKIIIKRCARLNSQVSSTRTRTGACEYGAIHEITYTVKYLNPRDHYWRPSRRQEDVSEGKEGERYTMYVRYTFLCHNFGDMSSNVVLFRYPSRHDNRPCRRHGRRHFANMSPTRHTCLQIRT